MAGRMPDPNLDALYARVLAASTLAVFVAGLLLVIAHVLAIHGRRVLPEPFVRVAGATLLGLAVGLSTLVAGGTLLIWVLVVGFGLWMAQWLIRVGRIPELGIVLVGAGLPWVFVYILSLVIRPGDPTIGPADYRLPIAVAAMVVIGLGVMLVLVGPRQARRPSVATPMDRIKLVTGAIERAQAIGPVAAPWLIGFMLGVAGSSAVLILATGADALVRQALAFVAFIVLGVGGWLVTTPRRVRDAYEVLNWLVGSSAREWDALVGHRPRTFGGLRRMLDRLPDRDDLRPLRAELLAAFGRTDEAHRELAALPTETAWERFRIADLREYVGWNAGRPDDEALSAMEAAASDLDDPELRLRARGSVALARLRRDAAAGDPDAVDHLAVLRSDVGARAAAYQLRYGAGVVIAMVLMGAFAAVASLTLFATR